MAKSTTVVSQGPTPDIALNRDRWIPFLAEFTRENRGAHARVDVLGPNVGYQVETEDRPFDGTRAYIKDGEEEVWVPYVSTLDDRLTHGIQIVAAIWVRPAVPGRAGAA